MVKFARYDINMIDFDASDNMVQNDVNKLRSDAEMAITDLEDRVAFINDQYTKMEEAIKELHNHCVTIDITNAKVTEMIETVNGDFDVLENNISETFNSIKDQNMSYDERIIIIEKQTNDIKYKPDPNIPSLLVVIIGLLGIISGIVIYNSVP